MLAIGLSIILKEWMEAPKMKKTIDITQSLKTDVLFSLHDSLITDIKVLCDRLVLEFAEGITVVSNGTAKMVPARLYFEGVGEDDIEFYRLRRRTSRKGLKLRGTPVLLSEVITAIKTKKISLEIIYFVYSEYASVFKCAVYTKRPKITKRFLDRLFIEISTSSIVLDLDY